MYHPQLSVEDFCIYSDKSVLPFVLVPTPARQESLLLSLRRAGIFLTAYKLLWDIRKRHMCNCYKIVLHLLWRS